ncbi:unnamed protein product, partial [Linum tenue]
VGTCSPGGTGSCFFRNYAAREFNILLWVSLIAITALLLERVLQLFRLWVMARKIPDPPCTSFFGHGGGGFLSRENFMEFVSQSHNKYGSVCKLWLGPTQLMVSIKDPTLVREVLSKAQDKLPFTGKAFRLAFGRSSLFVCPYEQLCRKNDKIYYGSGQMCYGKTASFSKKDGISSPRDFLQDQLSLLEIDSHQYSAEELCGNIMGIMFHGCLSTAGLISAVLERMATNPKIQHKVYTEITMLRQVSEKESHGAVNMPLLLATIYESARVLASGLVLQICSLKDGINKLYVENVPETTEEVNATKGPLILNDPTNNPAFLPFGSGVRACACQKPVITGVGAMLASLIASYEVRASPLGLTKMFCFSFVGFIPTCTLL